MMTTSAAGALAGEPAGVAGAPPPDPAPALPPPPAPGAPPPIPAARCTLRTHARIAGCDPGGGPVISAPGVGVGAGVTGGVGEKRTTRALPLKSRPVNALASGATTTVASTSASTVAS